MNEEQLRAIVDFLLAGVDLDHVDLGMTSCDKRSAAAAVAATPVFAPAREYVRRLQRAEMAMVLQRSLGGPKAVPRLTRTPPSDLFYANYYRQNRPVVIQGWAKETPAFKRWSGKDFQERFGGVPVDVTTGRTDDPGYDKDVPRFTVTVPLGDFVSWVESQDLPTNDSYMVAQNKNLERPDLKALIEEIGLQPDGILEPQKTDGCVSLWYGPAGTLTPVHHDNSNVLFVQIRGQKVVQMAPPATPAALDAADGFQSAVEPDETWYRATLEEGDALFIPVGWWHQVVAVQPSICLSLTNFREPNSFEWYQPGAL
jgi:hypothetical protein